MNLKTLKKTAIIFLSVIGIIYALFLIAPFIVTNIVKNYIPTINNEIKKATGLNSNIENLQIITTPMLNAGLKIEKFEILTPDNKEILEAENFSVKLSLIPLLRKKIEIDSITLDSFEAKIGIKKDGSFEIEKYLPETGTNTEAKTETSTSNTTAGLPFGIKLSNHLPDIKIKEHEIEFINTSTNEKYEIKGNNTEITDFILNKSIKIKADGNAKLLGKEQFSYKIKINNKIMPELNLHDLVFNPVINENQSKEAPNSFDVNIINIFKGIYNNKINANLDADLVLTKNGSTGYINADKLSIVNLPESNINLKFKGNKINIDSALYTAINEFSTIKGFVQKDKKFNMNLDFKSNVELNNIIKILNAIAMTFDIKDLQTLSANGKLDADFNLKSSSKSINSNGYFKIPSANIYYGIYNIGIDDINADIQLSDNNINFKNIGFSILNQPLKFYGTIDKNAYADLHLLGEKISLKGLAIACGQAVLLKENPIYSGLINIKADLTGKLDKIKPTAKISLNNIHLKNTPSNTSLKLPETNIDITSDGKTFTGNAVSENIQIINPAATISTPKISANINPDVVEVNKSSIKIDNINFDVSGKIKNYLTNKIILDFLTEGDIKSTLSGDINLNKQALNLAYITNSDSTIVIPMFDKSKMTFNCNIGINGNMMNPNLSGNINIPTLTIPEIPVIMNNLAIKLNGPILKGYASLSNFATGGIVASNITSDFSLKGENFYLTSLNGEAFDGKINGNIIYNLSNAHTLVDFHGQNLDAEKSIAGAVGISNALSGNLDFDTNLSLKVVDYEKMMKSLKGDLNFKINQGSFGNIGRIENFFNADNIVNNVLLRTTVGTISSLKPIKDSAKYEYITGEISFDNGWANLDSIKSTGETLAYYVTGKFNLINMTTNVIILGRLDDSIIKILGPIGDLSAEKLLSSIPTFGTLTANIAKALTTNPKNEKISEIPALTSNSNYYKDFKVVFNGGIESTSSIKSFKWLNDIDTSAIESPSISDTLKTIKSSVDTDMKNVVDAMKLQKEQFKDTTDELKNTANELKNLFKF